MMHNISVKAPATLVLADGTSFPGTAFGSPGGTDGEVVFNTSMTGYQEILTDPSYAGQIVVLTYPLIGNYGVNEADVESSRPQVRGLVVREAAEHPSNWRSQESLSDYLARYGITGLAGVDTRRLTQHIRVHGSMPGRIVVGGAAEADAGDAGHGEHRGHDDDAGHGEHTGHAGISPLVATVTTPHPYHLPGPGPRVVAVDFGIKHSILRLMQAAGIDTWVVPAWSTAREIASLDPQGLFLSNGPGDPAENPAAIAAVRELAGRLPIFGICLGHQILALALGASTHKLKFGHHGGNHAVREVATGRLYITTHNHGYTVRGLPSDLETTFVDLTDGSIEGFRHRYLDVYGVQFHPEAGPGPHDTRHLFDPFWDRLRR